MNNIRFNAIGTAIGVAPMAFIFSFQLGVIACLAITVAATALAYITTNRWEKSKLKDTIDH